MRLLPYLIIVVAMLGMLSQSTRIIGPAHRLVGAATPDWLWRIARWLYGGYFLYVAILIGHMLLAGGPTIHQPTAAAKAFFDAMNTAGFFQPLLMVDYALGGGALLFRRTAPLGLALLAPSVGVIFLFHLRLTGNVAWGTGWALAWAMLAWRYQAGFDGLWNYASEPQPL